MSVYVRPCRLTDLDALEQLAYDSPVGLTSLPEDREVLARRLSRSEQSFARAVTEPAAEEYLFALVGEQDQLLGVSGILARAGTQEPYFNFRREWHQTCSQALAETRVMERLVLTTENTGKSVFSAFFISAAHQTLFNTELLARARILYMAMQPQRFCEQVIVEFVGVADEQAESPFWNAIGKAFFAMEYDEAEHLNATRRKHFIGELIPQHPIYVDLLPPAARAVLGDFDRAFAKVHQVAMLEGFGRTPYIDIFDAGPCYQIARDQLRTLRECQRGSPALQQPLLQARGDGLEFRCRVDQGAADAAACVAPFGYLS